LAGSPSRFEVGIITILAVSADPGRRERKKERTRRAIAEAALRQFAERGFDATTVESICDEADVALSTFYAYFASKEATAFADADARAELVERTLTDRPSGEPLHVALRRASHAVVDQDAQSRDEIADRLRLLAGEPKLAGYAARLQAGYVERLARVLADHMRVELAADPRPRLVLSAVFGALNAVWATWAANTSHDLRDLVDQAHDTLDGGFKEALNPARR
jgi:AcrR family transcriptional regulator